LQLVKRQSLGAQSEKRNIHFAEGGTKKRSACGKYPIFCSYQSVKALVLSLKNGVFILPKAEQKSGAPAANTQFLQLPKRQSLGAQPKKRSIHFAEGGAKKRNACGKYPIFCSYQSVKALKLNLKNGIFILPLIPLVQIETKETRKPIFTMRLI
jgi:hypothetical protein